MATQPTQHQINDGPCKWDLMLALFDNTFDSPHFVTFTFLGTDGVLEEIRVYIDSVSREDGSGESWCFEGHTRPDNRRVRGYFSTKRRHGTLTQE